MNKEQFRKELDDIYQDLDKYQNNTIIKIEKILNLACKEISNYFLRKGFIFESYQNKKINIDYFYDPVTKIGFSMTIPSVYLGSDYNSISLDIVYKTNSKFLEYNKSILFLFKREDPEKVYNRFKKFIGKAEITRMKKYLRLNYQKDMLISDRGEKIKNITSLQ